MRNLQNDDIKSWGNGDWLAESSAPLPQRQPSKRSDVDSLSPVGEVAEMSSAQRQSSSGSDSANIDSLPADDSNTGDKRPTGSSFSVAVHGGNVKWSWPDQANKPKL